MSEASHLGTATGKSCLDQPQGPTCSLIWLWIPSCLPPRALITSAPLPNLVHAPSLNFLNFSLYLCLLEAHLKNSVHPCVLCQTARWVDRGDGCGAVGQGDTDAVVSTCAEWICLWSQWTVMRHRTGCHVGLKSSTLKYICVYQWWKKYSNILVE